MRSSGIKIIARLIANLLKIKYQFEFTYVLIFFSNSENCFKINYISNYQLNNSQRTKETLFGKYLCHRRFLSKYKPATRTVASTIKRHR